MKLADAQLTVAAAAALLGLRRHQVLRLRQVPATAGPTGLVSRKRGRPSNDRRGATFCRTVLALVREQYADFVTTLAAEKLAERLGLRLGVETLRQWMIAEELWIDRRHSLPSPHQPRRRRECLGELESRGPVCTLLSFIDDATSRIMLLPFVTSKSAFDYLRATRPYLEAYGKPVAFYSDKHSIFWVTDKDAASGSRNSPARWPNSTSTSSAPNIPQAMGRVEWAFGTLHQLVTKLRLADIASIAAANAWLPTFIAGYNQCFAWAPANAKDLHRLLTPADDAQPARITSARG